jgi:hypothetical protein
VFKNFQSVRRRTIRNGSRADNSDRPFLETGQCAYRIRGVPNLLRSSHSQHSSGPGKGWWGREASWVQDVGWTQGVGEVQGGPGGLGGRGGQEGRGGPRGQVGLGGPWGRGGREVRWVWGVQSIVSVTWVGASLGDQVAAARGRRLKTVEGQLTPPGRQLSPDPPGLPGPPDPIGCDCS